MTINAHFERTFTPTDQDNEQQKGGAAGLQQDYFLLICVSRSS